MAKWGFIALLPWPIILAILVYSLIKKWYAKVKDDKRGNIGVSDD